MKYAHLRQINGFLENFKKISAIKRTGDMVIFIEFDGKIGLFFDLSKADSAIYENENFLGIKEYKAPFDIALKRRFWGAKIVNLSVLEGNRILKIDTMFQGAYKSLTSSLYLEFTGRFTNAIITDEKGVIVEALRHIDNSFRVIKPGRALKELPKIRIKEKAVGEIDDFRQFFKDEFSRINSQNLESLRAVKRANVAKKIENLYKIVGELENEEELIKQSEILSQNATLILANLGSLKEYDRNINLINFSGEEVEINLTDSPKNSANAMFAKAKRLKQKASGLVTEKENLQEKLWFFSNLDNLLIKAKSKEELEVLMPKNRQSVRQKEQNQNIENFYINEYKISIGRNEKGNIRLLKNSKKDDVWLHLKDISSAHVIIKSQKAMPPPEILEFAAKICVQFSVKSSGTYEVDFTKRNNVKILNGANVNYVSFKTIIITI